MTLTSNLNNSILATVVSVASAILVTTVVTALWREKKRRANASRIPDPDKWRRVGTLSQLTIYPLKSGAGFDLEEAECTEIGLTTTENNELKLRDRFFVIFNNSVMKTARQHPNMLHIKVVKASDTSITFTAPEMDDLTVDIPVGSDTTLSFGMWGGERMCALDCGDEAAKWLGAYLRTKPPDSVRLGYFKEATCGRRDCNKKPWKAFRRFYPRFRRFDSGAYSDLAPYMLMNEASVEDLRQRTAEKVPTLSARWFRPNILVTGAEAFEEDTWDYIRIGETAVFQNFKPCARCIMTTIDPDTAVKSADMQPLKTLRSYRQLADPEAAKLEGEQSPALGCYLALRQPGPVRTGDPVYVAEAAA